MFQDYPLYKEEVLKGGCPSDCSSCPTFPASFRRIGEASYSRFVYKTLAPQKGLAFAADRMLRIVFVLSGSLTVSDLDTNKVLSAGDCVCLARKRSFSIRACEESRVVILSLIHRIEFCEQDIFDKEMPRDTVIASDMLPVLPTHPAIEGLLSGMGVVRELDECAHFQKIKVSELFMMIKVLYKPSEHAYFFQSIIQPRDNFRVFVCNNFDRAQSVPELATLAGMSLSVFKRRFAEHFNDSVYHWMMRQKAMQIFVDIREGEDNTKVLMDKYGFKHYTQFSRFCKNYLQATPAQLIASIKEG